MSHIFINVFKNCLLSVTVQAIFIIIGTIMLSGQQSGNSSKCFVLFNPHDILIIFKYIKGSGCVIVLINFDILK